jgi:murein DD-endopeptidase MepM/ murein hydrolase activator NlpD
LTSLCDELHVIVEGLRTGEIGMSEVHGTQIEESRWSWLRLVRPAQKRPNREAHENSDVFEDVENPWLSLHQQSLSNAEDTWHNAPRIQSPAVVEKPTIQNKRTIYRSLDDTELSASQDVPLYGTKNAPVRWLNASESTLGMVDDDGTLSQVESPAWRFWSNGRRKQRFVPAKTAKARSPLTSKGSQGDEPSTGGTLVLQCVFALVLVATGYYAKHYSTPTAKQIETIYETAFSQDFAKDTLPKVETFLTSHHVSLPSIWGTGALVLHQPISGTIVSDYSDDHPTMVLAGKPDAPVLAAGSGTVVSVVRNKDGYSIAIDHGKSEVSWYSGVVSPSVHPKEYVYSGQMIGRLANTNHPELGFALKKDGTFTNPHAVIHFTQSQP